MTSDYVGSRTFYDDRYRLGTVTDFSISVGDGRGLVWEGGTHHSPGTPSVVKSPSPPSSHCPPDLPVDTVRP